MRRGIAASKPHSFERSSRPVAADSSNLLLSAMLRTADKTLFIIMDFMSTASQANPHPVEASC
jgi:hypothetical protein